MENKCVSVGMHVLVLCFNCRCPLFAGASSFRFLLGSIVLLVLSYLNTVA